VSVCRFPVKSVVVREELRGTSFENWMSYPLAHPCLVGEVTVTLSPDRPLCLLQYRLKATGNFYARYVRGPWLLVGEAEFGTAKDDAIFPGVEWAIDDEWSSGSDWFKHPWSERFVPHPYKVTSPVITHEDDTWRPHNLPATYELYRQGQFDYCYADTHNSTTGYYGGMCIMPDPIALNIYGVLDSRED
jgi:hypothetical protein